MDNDRIVVYYGAEPFLGCLSDADAVRSATSAPGYGPPLRDETLDRARSSRELGVALRDARRGEAERARVGGRGDEEGGGDHLPAGSSSLLDLATGLIRSSRSALSASAQRLVSGSRGGGGAVDGSRLLPAPLTADHSALGHRAGDHGGAGLHLRDSPRAEPPPPLQGGGHVAIRVSGQQRLQPRLQNGGGGGSGETPLPATGAGANAAASTRIRAAEGAAQMGSSTPGGGGGVAGGAPSRPPPRVAGTVVSPQGKRFVAAHVAALSRVVVRVRMMNRVKGLLVVSGERGGREGTAEAVGLTPASPPPPCAAPQQQGRGVGGAR